MSDAKKIMDAIKEVDLDKYVKKWNQSFPPSLPCLTKNSKPNVVLPQPHDPAAKTVEPYGMPPRNISSRPCIPVTHRSRT